MKHKKVTAFLLAGSMAAALMLGGCGSKIDSDAIVATCGDQELTLGYLNFCLHYDQVTYDSFYVYYYGATDYWHSAMDDEGTTMEDSVKDTVLTVAEMNCLLAEHMDDYDVVVTEEDKINMRAAADEFMEENTNEAIKAMGATSDYVAEMLWYEIVGERMQAAIEDEVGNDLDIADYARRTFSYVIIDITSYTDDDGETVDYTEDEVEELRAEAEVMDEEMKEDFDGTAEEYGYSVYDHSYGDDEETEEDGGLYPAAVLEEADRMTEGEVSGVIDGDDGYLYIIRLDSEDDEEAAEEAMETASEEIKSDYYTEVTDGYLEDSDFTVNEELWDQVKITDMFSIVYDEEEEAEE